LPSLLLANAIFVPSADQSGDASDAGAVVSRTGLVPSAFIT
jgi:hypothetical protein